MIDLFELYFHEDCPYEDETVELLGIKGKGTLKIVSRETGVCACADELAEHYRKKGIKIYNSKTQQKNMGFGKKTKDI